MTTARHSTATAAAAGPAALAALDAELAAWPGTVSVWCGPAGSTTPAYSRRHDETHYAASTMKVAVLAALYRAAGAGTVDLDAPVPVVNDFTSARPGAPRFALEPGDDQDDEVWDRLGQTATLRWLARRMIIRSSNLATNVALSHVGLPAVAEVLRRVGTTHSRIGRGIADPAARDAGIDNRVTARDLAMLLGAIAVGTMAAGTTVGATAVGTTTVGATAVGAGQTLAPATGQGRERLAGPEMCVAMLEVLSAQERREDLAAGLPPETRIAHKNGWVTGVRHGAGVVFPDDAAPYAIVVCTTRDAVSRDTAAAADRDACALIAGVAAASWADRYAIGAEVDGGSGDRTDPT